MLLFFSRSIPFTRACLKEIFLFRTWFSLQPRVYTNQMELAVSNVKFLYVSRPYSSSLALQYTKWFHTSVYWKLMVIMYDCIKTFDKMHRKVFVVS